MKETTVLLQPPVLEQVQNLDLVRIKMDQDKVLIDKIEVLELLLTSTKPKDTYNGGGSDYELAISSDNRDTIETKIMNLIKQL